MSNIVPAVLGFQRPQCTAEHAEPVEVRIVRGSSIEWTKVKNQYPGQPPGYTKDRMTVRTGGDYLLGFFAAGYDRTGGTFLGSKLFVKRFSYELAEEG